MKSFATVSYRRHDWLNFKTLKPQYGIQIKLVGADVRWLHCSEDGKPLLYSTEEERDLKLKELRKKSKYENTSRLRK